MVVLNRLGESPAGDEAHRVTGVVAIAGFVRLAEHVVEGDDARVFQLPGDAGLLQEAGSEPRIADAVGPEFLERHVAAKHAVAGQPDLPQPAGAMESDRPIARPAT